MHHSPLLKSRFLDRNRNSRLCEVCARVEMKIVRLLPQLFAWKNTENVGRLLLEEMLPVYSSSGFRAFCKEMSASLNDIKADWVSNEEP